ncbi:MAG: acyltransferase [Actinomycetales bacterium]|nr:acyltransferase [Actinomycetales bacterium]
MSAPVPSGGVSPSRQSVPLATCAGLRWVIRHRAFTPGYLVRYLRLLRLRCARKPGLVIEGLVFLGRGVRIEVRPGYGRLILGPWVHIGDHTALRVHEGSMTIGPKVVIGQRVVLDCHLDIEIGEGTLIADGVHVLDFDHRFDDPSRPIKDQGIVKSPVRIGPGCWLGGRATVLRGSRIGTGSVIGAHAVVRGEIPAHAVAVGVPARVMRRVGPGDGGAIGPGDGAAGRAGA